MSLRFGHYVDLAFEHGDTVSKRKDLAQVLRDYIRVFRANITHYLPDDDSQLQLLRTFNYEEYLNERIEAPHDPETHEGFSAAMYGFSGDVDPEEPTLYWASACGNTPNRASQALKHICPPVGRRPMATLPTLK